jgi:hypothetical protein
MDENRFDELIQRYAKLRITRLAAVQGLIGSVIAGVTGTVVFTDGIDAKRQGNKGNGRGKNNGKKVTICHNGQTITVSKKAKKKHLKHGDSVGACSDQTPPPPPPPVTCPGGSCTATSCGTGCTCVSLGGGPTACAALGTCRAGNCGDGNPCGEGCTCVSPNGVNSRCVSTATCPVGNCAGVPTPVTCGPDCMCLGTGLGSRCIARVA